jgi:hypothetical protein
MGWFEGGSRILSGPGWGWSRSDLFLFLFLPPFAFFLRLPGWPIKAMVGVVVVFMVFPLVYLWLLYVRVCAAYHFSSSMWKEPHMDGSSVMP